MRRILNPILTALLHAIAFLPFWMLYGLSDILFVICYYVVRYRRKVVMINLRDSFKDKSEKELKGICRDFYRNFSDYIVESIKLLHISDQEMQRRMQFVGIDMIDDILASGQSIAAYFSHCFNWEWAPSVTLWSCLCNRADETNKCPENEKPVEFCQVYRPLKDKWFDALMLKVRGRFHPVSVAKQHTLRHLIQLRRDGIASITGFMSDQKPSHGDPTYVTMFLNRPTAMITGTETLARRLGMAAIYWDMEKLKRGHYRITCRLIGRNLSEIPNMGVTERYARLLEKTIERDPALWLWTHKRWKIPVKLPENFFENKSESSSNHIELAR